MRMDTGTRTETNTKAEVKTEAELNLFDKIYCCYYQAVRRILEEAAEGAVTTERMREICRASAFEESALAILPELTGKSGAWRSLLWEEDGGFSSALGDASLKAPLSRLQRAWLRAVCSDPRFLLFFDEPERELLLKWLDGEEGINPLYRQEDFYYYDQFQDGDDYGGILYRKHFRTILAALMENRMLKLSYMGKRQLIRSIKAVPKSLQYSPKDDKFRLLCVKPRPGKSDLSYTLNVGRILNCCLCEKLEQAEGKTKPLLKAGRTEAAESRPEAEPAVIEIDGRRNSLERCMLKFADYEKHTEFDEERGIYICSIYYDIQDETELLIDLLSFGPVIRVTRPMRLVEQVRERVKRQNERLFGDC